MVLVDVQIAARNLMQHTRRTLFLGAAIASVTALLVLLGGLTNGIRATMLESATTLMTGHVNVGGFYKVTSGMAAPMVTDYEKAAVIVRRDVPELDYFVARGRGWGKGVSESGSMDLILGGLDIAGEQGFRRVVQVSQGSLDALAEPRTILLFEEQAKRLKVAAGDSITLSSPTARGTYNTVDVRIAAVGKSIGVLSSFNAFVSNATILELYQLKPGTTGALQLYLKRAADSASVAARLRTSLGAAGFRIMEPDPQPYWIKLMQKVNKEDWVGQKLDVTTWEDEMSFMSFVLTALDALTALLVGILIVIVGVGIMNTMWIAIRERTREIGTLRAIGMQRRGVLRMFLFEGVLLGLAGTSAGAIAGASVAAVLNALKVGLPEAVRMLLMNDHLWLQILPGSVVRAAAIITFFTVAAAFYPSWRAARLRPVTAIHHIG